MLDGIGRDLRVVSETARLSRRAHKLIVAALHDTVAVAGLTTP